MLLNKTDTQIQDIASQVGILDVNYFIRFLKLSDDPKEYRIQLRSEGLVVFSRVSHIPVIYMAPSARSYSPYPGLPVSPHIILP